MLTCSYTQPWECFHFSFSSSGDGRIFFSICSQEERSEGMRKRSGIVRGKGWGFTTDTIETYISGECKHCLFPVGTERDRGRKRERENKRDCTVMGVASTHPSGMSCQPIRPFYSFVSLTLPPSILKEPTEETHGLVSRRARGPRAEIRSECRL